MTEILTLEDLEKAIQPLYLVGGSVRDELLGLIPKDTDYATPLSPDQVEAIIKAGGRRAIQTGKKFGTIGIIIDKKLVEITTFRSEKYEEGNRKPIVEFVDNLTHDLSRRDFTINAMAKRGNKIIDPFGGQQDIKDKLIRCVGIPAHRFKEDPLRLLRAARFVAQLNFNLDPLTVDSMHKLNYKILQVSKERWTAELDKLLLSDKPSQGLWCLLVTRLMNYMIPELTLQYLYDQKNPAHDRLLWEHTLAVVDSTPKDLHLRWAALLHDIAKPFMCQEKPGRNTYIHHDLVGKEFVLKIANNLKWGRERTNKIAELVLNHMREDSPLRSYDNAAKKWKIQA